MTDQVVWHIVATQQGPRVCLVCPTTMFSDFWDAIWDGPIIATMEGPRTPWLESDVQNIHDAIDRIAQMQGCPTSPRPVVVHDDSADLGVQR